MTYKGFDFFLKNKHLYFSFYHLRLFMSFNNYIILDNPSPLIFLVIDAVLNLA